MKESEATNGQKLHALIISFQMRTTFQTALKHINGAPKDGWDDLALALQRELIESMPDFSVSSLRQKDETSCCSCAGAGKVGGCAVCGRVEMCTCDGSLHPLGRGCH